MLALMLATLSLCAAAPVPAPASVPPRTHPPDVTNLCGPTSSYACAPGGYTGSAPGAWGQAYNRYPHNCTTYVAFRLAQNGVGYPGWHDNANGWARQAALHGTPTNDVAAVGSIAVWTSGLSGHVAYVESVTPNWIDVSEDAYYPAWPSGGYTRQERILRSSPAWPDAFVHFKDLGRRPADINSDGRVNIKDLSILLHLYGQRWHPPLALADLNSDGIVDIFDLSILLSGWSPRGLARATVASAPALQVHVPPRAGPLLARRPSRTVRGPRPKLLVTTSSLAQGGQGMLVVDALGMARCGLRFLGPLRQRTRSFDATLSRQRRYVLWRWRADPHARRGAWTVNVTCSTRHGGPRTISTQLQVRGRHQGAQRLVKAAHAKAFVSAPARHPGAVRGRGCPRSRVDTRSGYCYGSAAEYVWSRRGDSAALGPVAGWWHKTADHKGGLPSVGGIAWWATGKRNPYGHVAYVERVTPQRILVTEQDVYGAALVDRAWLPRHGRSAPDGYIYLQRVGAAALSVWPEETEARAGQEFQVELRLAVSGDNATAAEADLSYPPDALTFVSAELAGDPQVDDTWGQPQVDSSAGHLRVRVASKQPVSGDHPVAYVTFRAATSGSFTLSLTGSPAAMSASAGDPIPTNTAAGTATLLPALPPPAISILSLSASSVGGAALRAASDGSVPLGSTFDVPVYLHVQRGHVNTVASDLTYPADKLSYVGATVNSGVWGVPAVTAGGTGDVDVEVGTTGAADADVLVATLSFKAIATGTAALSFTPYSGAIDDISVVDTLAGASGATYTIVP